MAKGAGDLKAYDYRSESINKDVKISRGMIGAVGRENFHEFASDLHRCNKNVSAGQAQLLWKELLGKKSRELNAISKSNPPKSALSELIEKQTPKGKGTISGLEGASFGDFLSEDGDYGTSALDALLAEGENRQGVKVSPKSTGKRGRG